MIANGKHNKTSSKVVLRGVILTIFTLALIYTPLKNVDGLVHAASLVPDDGLRVVINESLKESDPSINVDNYEPTIEDLESLEMLHANDSNIADLTGLEHAKNLKTLNLYTNKITDLSPLAELTNLVELGLYTNKVEDISPLAGLTNLEGLDLGNNNIGNIDTLGNLTKLKHLDVSQNKVVDISSIKNLTNLNSLGLFTNEISDISPLVDLENLVELLIYSNNISDISALSGLTNLVKLEIYNNNISDITALEGLTSLQILDISTNKISDVSPLAELHTLKKLELFSNKISNVSPLKDLKNSDTFISLGNQSIKLDEVNLSATDTDLEIENFIIYFDGSILDGIDVKFGSYDPNNQMIKWDELTRTDTVGTFLFTDSTDGEDRFSGNVIQPISWDDVDVTEVELPTPEFTEATCDEAEVNYFISAVEGVEFEVSGDVEEGGTITITAIPDENIELVATDGWLIGSGKGYYEHTFDGLEDCDAPSPETTKVNLPTPDLRDATCDVQEVYYFIPAVKGIKFEVNGDAEAGGTITIVARPDENVELIATDGWTLNDGYGFYEHTFNELGECEKEEPLKPKPDQNDSDDNNGSEDNDNNGLEDDDNNGSDDNEKQLPKTSTNTFNMMAVGLALLLLGSISYIYIRRKVL